MSIEASNWAWTQVSGIKPNTLLVLLALADRADAKGDCFPGVTDLQTRTKLSRHRVLDAILQLEAAGAIRVDRDQPRQGKRRAVNHYHLEVGTEITVPRPPRAPRTGTENGNQVGSTFAPGWFNICTNIGSHGDTGTFILTTTEPSPNHHSETSSRRDATRAARTPKAKAGEDHASKPTGRGVGSKPERTGKQQWPSPSMIEAARKADTDPDQLRDTILNFLGCESTEEIAGDPRLLKRTRTLWFGYINGTLDEDFAEYLEDHAH